eukprot:UN08899
MNLLTWVVFIFYCFIFYFSKKTEIYEISLLTGTRLTKYYFVFFFFFCCVGLTKMKQ